MKQKQYHCMLLLEAYQKIPIIPKRIHKLSPVKMIKTLDQSFSRDLSI